MATQPNLEKGIADGQHIEVLGQNRANEPQGVPYDREVEKRLVRKLDLNFVPLLFVLYMLSFLDRSNIGNANAAGMSENLKISDAKYQWLLTIFYIAYIVFEWMVLLWKILPPHIYATCCIFSWGLIAMMQGVAQNWPGMMSLRFLLGAAEAGFGPGVPYFMSFFYLREELGKRVGVFLAAAPLGTTFAGALAFGLTSAKTSIAGWRLLFLVEGAPTVIMAAFVFFFLPPTPQRARFLTNEEKNVAYARGVRQVGDKVNERIGMPDWGEMLVAIKDPKNWLTALMNFSANVSFSSISVFLPTILKAMGYTSIRAQGLTCPPYFLSFIITIASTQLADRFRQRGIIIMIFASLGGAGYLMLAIGKSTAVRYAGVFLAALIFPVVANLFPWCLNNQRSDTKRGVGMVMFQLVGQCGTIVGTRLYPAHERPYYVKGMSVCASFMFFVVLLAFTLRTLLLLENKKWDKEQASRELQSDDKTQSQPKMWYGEENTSERFRNIL